MEKYFRFSMVSYFFLLILFLLLGLLVSRSGVFGKFGSGEPIAVFFSSYAVTYLANLVGYLDIPLAILTVSLLLVRSATSRAVAAVPVCLIGIFLHEMFLITFFPIILFSFVIDGFEMQALRAKRGIWLTIPGLAAITLAMTVRLSLQRPFTAYQVAEMSRDVARRADFGVDTNVFRVFGRSTSDNLEQMRVLFHNPGWLIEFGVNLAAFVPTMLMLLLAIWLVLRKINANGQGRMVLPLAFVAALSPFLMFFFGYDCGRWDTLVCLESFLVLVLLARSISHKVEGFTGNYHYASILVIGLSLSTGGILFGRKVENKFPFLLDLHTWAYEVKHYGWVCPDCLPGH